MTNLPVPAAAMMATRIEPRHHRGKITVAVLISLIAVTDALFYTFPPAHPNPSGLNVTVFFFALALASIVAHFGELTARKAVNAFVLITLALLPSLEASNFLTVSLGLVGLGATAVALSDRFQSDLVSRANALRGFLLGAPFALMVDTIHSLTRLSNRKSESPDRTWLKKQISLWLMPVGLAGIFIGLFSLANPLIAHWVNQFSLGVLADLLSPGRLLFWLVVLALCWPFVRTHASTSLSGRAPGRQKRQAISGQDRAVWLSEPAIFRGLLLFNLIFAVQSGLDLAFLWSGLQLPDGMTLSLYARKGAYTLIVTALLAAAFVIFATKPGSPTSQSKRVRSLVLAWTVQNILLVVSSILRLKIYVDALDLTFLRVSSFFWMLLVLFGLCLVLVRVIQNRSNRWLMTMNLIALSVTLYGISFVNLPALISNYNVTVALAEDHNRLDVGYLNGLGVEAIPAMDRAIAAFQQQFSREPTPGNRVRDMHALNAKLDRLRSDRASLLDQLNNPHANWMSWTYRRDRLKNRVLGED